MPPDSFLHKRNDFKALVETVAKSEKINDPALVEKDRPSTSGLFPICRKAQKLPFPAFD
jgi:hypothetical protein